MGSLEYIALNKNATDIIFLCHDQFYFIYDSLKPISSPQKQEKQNANKIDYIYTQSDGMF